jgi:hypothetical protein
MVLGAQIEEIRSITVHSVHGDDGLETHSSRCSLFFPAACMPLFIPRLVLAHSSGLPHPMTGNKKRLKTQFCAVLRWHSQSMVTTVPPPNSAHPTAG